MKTGRMVTLLLIATFAIACSGTFETPNSPTALSSGGGAFNAEVGSTVGSTLVAQGDSRLPDVIVQAGIECPSAAPVAIIDATQLTENSGTVNIRWALDPRSDQVRFLLFRDVENKPVLVKTVRETTTKGQNGLKIPMGDGKYTVEGVYEFNGPPCFGAISNKIVRVVVIAGPLTPPAPECKPKRHRRHQPEGFSASSYSEDEDEDDSCRPRRRPRRGSYES